MALGTRRFSAHKNRNVVRNSVEGSIKEQDEMVQSVKCCDGYTVVEVVRVVLKNSGANVAGAEGE